jgi:hypothetical protein
LPRGRQLITLKDAADYITRAPKSEHDTETEISEGPSAPTGTQLP